MTVMSIVTFGCSAVKASAIACQSALPGSLFWMCHQSIVDRLAGVGRRRLLGAVRSAGGVFGWGALGRVFGGCARRLCLGRCAVGGVVVIAAGDGDECERGDQCDRSTHPMYMCSLHWFPLRSGVRMDIGVLV